MKIQFVLVLTVGGLLGFIVGRTAKTVATVQHEMTVIQEKSHNDMQQLEWEDGVFWGSLAAFRGANTLHEALVKAYELRRSASESVKAHAAELNKVRSTNIYSTNINWKINP